MGRRSSHQCVDARPIDCSVFLQILGRYWPRQNENYSMKYRNANGSSDEIPIRKTERYFYFLTHART